MKIIGGMENGKIDKSWTLFLDRDGVINRRLLDDYVKSWSEFEFLPGVPEAIAGFSERFGRIVVVTNQQGIAKDLMTESDLQSIHNQMILEIQKVGGRIDKVYYCPHHRQDNCACRKPRIGMAEQAKADFPEIDFATSIMIGDTPSDIEFGKRAGMRTVFVSTTEHAPPHADLQVASLAVFADKLENGFTFSN